MASIEDEEQPTLAETFVISDVENGVSSESISEQGTLIMNDVEVNPEASLTAPINYFGYTPLGRRLPRKEYFMDTPDPNGNVIVLARKSHCEPSLVENSKWALKTMIPALKWSKSSPKFYNKPSVPILSVCSS